MSGILWRKPSAEDMDGILSASESSGMMGSDCSYANIIMLKEFCNTFVSYLDGFFLRKYYGTFLENDETNASSSKRRVFYGYPLGEGNVGRILDMLRDDAMEEGCLLDFIYLTECQKDYVEKYFSSSLFYRPCPSLYDYVYSQNQLANLPGSANHKKRNHVSQFERSYPDFCFRPIGFENVKDVLAVEDEWLSEKKDSIGEYHEVEHDSIKFAVENFCRLKFYGGILYVRERPVAFTIASAISSNCLDVHFEKAIGEFAGNGAYAVINQQFSKSVPQFEYINREEDLGVEGLRKAKLSYHPVLILEKWIAEEKIYEEQKEQ